MKSKIIKTSIWIFVITVSGYIAFSILNIKGCSNPKEVIEQDSSIIRMNDSLKDANALIEIWNIELAKKLDSLSGIISTNDSIIKLLKTRRHEKVNVVNNLNDSELYKFLTDTSR